MLVSPARTAAANESALVQRMPSRAPWLRSECGGNPEDREEGARVWGPNGPKFKA